MGGVDPRLVTRVSDLIGTEVRTASGRRLGRVYDLRGELTSRSLRITGLAVGGLALLERLGIGAPESTERIRTRDILPWSAVIRADRRGVVVRDDAEERQ
jgi:sporulation protein YlmC with PRC-barrel domain